MRRAGAAAGAGEMGRLTTADSVPVTGESRSHSGPLSSSSREAGRAQPTHPPAPPRPPLDSRDARS